MTQDAASPQSTESATSERRQFRRYLKSLPLDYAIEREGGWVGGEGQLITVNFSAGGARVRLDEDVVLGDRLLLRLSGSQGAGVPSRVVWVQSSRVEGKTLAGLQFEALDETARAVLDLALADGRPE